MTEAIFLIIGIVIGAILTIVILKFSNTNSNVEDSNINFDELNQENQNLKVQIASLETKLEFSSEQIKRYEQELEELQRKHQYLIEEKGQLTQAIESLKKQQSEILEIEEKFKKEFEIVAGRLMEKNTQSFQNTSQQSLKGILDPLKEDLERFKKNIDDKYVKEAEAKASLKTEIESLVKLNEQLSDEAQNLTKALKGDNKQQGNWGEIVLERVLERSGLNKGSEYKTQEHIVTEDGTKRIPDAVVYLPDDKHIIIDSKVSLTAYQRMINSDDEEEIAKELKLHVASLKSHIKELGDKTYYDIKEFNSPDFTLMFLPIEASFSVALREDTDLFNYAWERNIVIVSPTTLLATLRTIESTWKQERQTRNVMEIARVGGTLYDKFYGFVEDLQKIEKGIQTSQTAYESAFKKLKTGKGNIIGQTERLKTLGAKAKKALSSELIDDAQELTIESNDNA